ncbi:MAG: Lrp/AsnC family transcriptional regulator [Saccharospirillum sp.]
MSDRLDRIDRRLLDALQRDARQTAAELAETVGLSPSPCARRIRLLEQDGYILGHKAQVDRDKLHLGITIFVQVRLSQHQEKLVEAFEETVQGMAEVISCHTVSGAFDYLLQVVASDLHGYEQWVRRLQRLPNVNTVDSSFAIRAVKTDGPLPIL